MTVIQDLPVDILINIIEYLDTNELLEISICSKFISSISLKKLWHSLDSKNILKFESILMTLNKIDKMFPYNEWIISIDISFEITEIIPENILFEFQTVELLNIKTLQLSNVQLNLNNSEILTKIFIWENIREINLNNCSVDIIWCLSNRMTRINAEKLNRIAIKDCYITDPWVKHIVTLTPKLKYFCSQRSGYISDTAILAITQNCPFIETLIITLPRHIIQSNTITFISIQSLSNCIYLKKFICRGQVRISNQESQDWLYSHCPRLEYCDLSF